MKEQVKNLTALEIEQGGKIVKAENKAHRINEGLKGVLKSVGELKESIEIHYEDILELEIMNRLSRIGKDIGYLIDDEEAASATAGVNNK